MNVYSVHMRRHGLNLDKDLVLVKEGFSFWAFLMSVVWALWHKMWWVAFALVLIASAPNLLTWALHLDPVTSMIISIGIAFLTGTLANDLSRWSLDRKGFAAFGIVTGKSEDEALARFLDADPAIMQELT